MKGVRRSVTFTLLIIASSLLWSIAIYRGQYLSDSFGAISIRFENKTLKPDEIRDIIRIENENYTNENIALTAWSEVRNTTVQNSELGREAKADAIYLFGQIPYGLNIYGSGQCALSADIAYKLWGTDNVTGNQIDIDKEKYIVAHILKSLNQTIILKGNDKETKGINALEVRAEGKAMDFQRFNDFLGRNNLGYDLKIDYIQASGFAEWFSLLPGWVAGVMIIFMVLRYINKIFDNMDSVDKGYIGIFRPITVFVVMAVVCLSVVKVTGFDISVPSEYIPTRWSDFEFWIEKLKNLTDDIRGYKLMKPSRMDLLFKDTFCEVLIFSIVASFFMRASVKMVKGCDRIMATVYMTSALIVPFGVFILLNSVTSGGWNVGYLSSAFLCVTAVIFTDGNLTVWRGKSEQKEKKTEDFEKQDNCCGFSRSIGSGDLYNSQLENESTTKS